MQGMWAIGIFWSDCGSWRRWTVRGNVDTEAWARRELPETAVAETGDVKIYVLHDVQALDLDPGAARFRVVVSGHSHKFGKSEKDGVWYVNPGSAGPRRFTLPITVARLDLGGAEWELEFVDLEKRVEGW
jgi:predicted phosphodiesterase